MRNFFKSVELIAEAGITVVAVYVALVNVNVGAGAKLFGNIYIGDDVNIGANAVVLSDIPSGCTAVGIPAKILYKTKDNVIVQHSK